MTTQVIPKPGKPWEVSVKERSKTGSLIVLAAILAGALVKLPDLLDEAVQGYLEDPDVQKRQFMGCMMDAQAVCFIEGAGIMPDEEIQLKLVERGWSNPTKWDCFWPKTKTVVENPYD